jgi:ketosteroid isomerase-like protein
MSDIIDIESCAREIAAAIGARDVERLRRLLTDDFVHRTLGGGSVEREPFLKAIGEMPWEILSVTLDGIAIDVADGSALVTGMQHARVRLDTGVVDDRRPFVDWFVKQSGGWRLRAAVEPKQAE